MGAQLDLLIVGGFRCRSAVSVPAIPVSEEEPAASAGSCSGETQRFNVMVRSGVTPLIIFTLIL